MKVLLKIISKIKFNNFDISREADFVANFYFLFGTKKALLYSLVSCARTRSFPLLCVKAEYTRSMSFLHLL